MNTNEIAKKQGIINKSKPEKYTYAWYIMNSKEYTLTEKMWLIKEHDKAKKRKDGFMRANVL